MSRNKLTPRVYTDVPRKNGEGTMYATFQVRYYGNEKERMQAEQSIKQYYAKLFKGEVHFDKVIQCFCIYDDANDSCIYKKTTFEIIREMVHVNLRNKETKNGDVAMLARIDNLLLHLDTYKTLNLVDYAIMVERFNFFGLPLYRNYADKYLQNAHTPLIRAMGATAKDLTPSEIVGKRMIEGNNLEECLAISEKLLKEGFEFDVVSKNLSATMEAIYENEN